MIELLSINIRFTLILKLTASSSFLSFIEFPLIFKIFIRTYFFILETTILLVKRTKEKISSVQLSIPALVSFHLGRQTNTPFFFFFLIQHAVIIERRIKDYTTYTIPYLLPSSSNILMLQIGEKKKNIPLANLYNISNEVRIFNDCVLSNRAPLLFVG